MKLKNWIRRSFRNRMFATILVATLVPLLLCDVVMMQVIVSRAEHTQAQQGRDALDTLSARFTDAAALYDDTAEALAASTITRSALRRTGEDSRLLYQFLYRRAAPLRPYADVDIYDPQGVCLYSTDAVLPAPLDTDWGALYAARRSEGTVFLRSDTGLLTVRTVTGYGGQLLGYVTVRMASGGFARLFDGVMAPADDLLVLDSTWRTVYYTRTMQAEDTVSALRSQLLAGQKLTGGEGDDCTFCTADGPAGFTLLLQQPRIYTGQVLRSLYLVGGALGFLCLALCAVAAWWLSRYLSRPVNALDDAMRQVEQGDYDVQLYLDSPDELGRLAASFNRMTEEYRQNLKRSVQRQRELNETQLRMLQAQLNPHFLYNTLDCMKWLGVANHVPQIADMSTDLAALLRAGISGSELIPLEDELELVRQYLNIQEIRFEDRFVCEIDVDERFQHCIVPKMVLQPLVENAIIHGVADLEEGYIKLWAESDGDDLLLRVSDNGKGIEPEVLARLARHEDIPGGHLGLNNVDRIIRLYYGEGYGLTAASDGGNGSCITLRLPMTKGEDHAEGIDR